MRRYRNARYAPESLERKLNPSTMGIAPPPAMVGPVAAPTDMIYAPPIMVAPAPAPTDMTYVAPTVVAPTPAPTGVTTAPTTVVSVPTCNYMFVDDELPTLPGEGPLVPLVPNPTGPVGPA